jgi:uncharacterized protein (DUF488 family)
MAGAACDVVTIGAYGWSADAFFDALVGAGVTCFCDVRARRGVRGPEYAFANSSRLQARLGALGIAYEHRPELAPSAGLRAGLAQADAAAGIRRRARTRLDPAFAAAYAAERLDGLDAAAFLAEHAGRTVCLFCVEREPAACHRSLVAERLADAGARVRHLLP